MVSARPRPREGRGRCQAPGGAGCDRLGDVSQRRGDGGWARSS